MEILHRKKPKAYYEEEHMDWIIWQSNISFCLYRNVCTELNIRNKPHLIFNMDEVGFLLIMFLRKLLPQKKLDLFYVQVTVRRDKFRKNNQLDASISKIYFCHKTLHVSGIFCAHHQELSIHRTHGNWYASCRLCDRLQAESGWNCVPTWWAQKMPETCRVLLQK